MTLLTVSATLGGFLFGYDTSVTGAANLYIYDDFNEDESTTKSIFVSLAVAGAVFGAIIGGVMGDYKGRKLTILLADLLFSLGALIMSVSPLISILYLGRFILGLGLGLASTIIPVYLS